MPVATSHPENRESRSLKISDELREFVTKLDHEVQESRGDRSEWETRQDVYMKKRYGIRSSKSFPWVGSANFVLPQIDSDINRQKPAYINLAFGVTPIVNFEPFGPEDVEPAKKRETLFDWRVKNQMKFFKDYCLGVDYAQQRGFTIFKITWKFSTRKYTKYLDLAEIDEEILDAMLMPEVTDDVLFHILAEEIQPDLGFQENVDEINRVIEDFREGKTRFEMEFVEKEENRADCRACDPRDEVSFPIMTTDLQQADHIDYRFWTSINEINQGINDEKYEEYDEYTINSWGVRNSQISVADNIRASRDGVVMHKRNNGQVLLHETCAWFDVNDDGIDERVLITYPDANPNHILRFIEVPYDHGMFPYVAVRRELNDSPIMSSRGIPTLDDDFQTGISTLFNQDIDAGTIATTPTVVTRKNSVKNLKNQRYVPGNVVETENGVSDYTVVQNYNLGQSHRFASMQYLKSWANDRIGNVTSAFSQINNPTGNGKGGSKSATESSEIAAAAGQLQQMDLLVWQMQMAEVYAQIDSLYEQFGDEEEYITMTNEEPIKITRKEIQGRFNIVPNGRLDNSNPVLRANKALSALQLFKGDPDINQVELKRWYISEVDPKMVRRLMLSEQAKAQNAQMARAAQNEAIKIQLGLKGITDRMDVQKEAMLSLVQGKKYAEN